VGRVVEQVEAVLGVDLVAGSDMNKPPLQIPRWIIEQWEGIVPTPPPGYVWVLLPDLDYLELQQEPALERTPGSLGNSGSSFSPGAPAEAGGQPEAPQQ
jgi:hypothetical protein